MKALFIFIFLIFLATPSHSKSDKALYQDLTDLVDEVDLTRSDLSQKTPKDVNQQSYKPVCLKVAANMRKIARQKKYKFRNASAKPRNSQNKPNKNEKAAIARFKNKPHLAAYWLRNESGFWYFRQIKGEEQCMSCHGKVVPGFIQEKYPNDRSRGHSYGSFMGIYSINITKKSK